MILQIRLTEAVKFSSIGTKKSYSLAHCANNEFAFCEANKPDTEIMCKDTDEVLELIVDGQKLREIITKVTVTERTI